MEKTIQFLMANLSYRLALTFLVLLAALHIIQSDVDPSWNFISEYQVGRFGWLMSAAFLAMALSCISLSVALWQPSGVIGKIGLLLLLVSAAGMIMAAVFKTDPLNTSPEHVTSSGALHQMGAMLDSIPFASLLISLNLVRRHKAWKQSKSLLLWSTLAVWLGLIVFIVSMAILFPADGKFGPGVLLGWQNRIMIVTQCLWLAIVAREAVKINAQTPVAP
jgi:hypothetical protein